MGGRRRCRQRVFLAESEHVADRLPSGESDRTPQGLPAYRPVEVHDVGGRTLALSRADGAGLASIPFCVLFFGLPTWHEACSTPRRRYVSPKSGEFLWKIAAGLTLCWVGLPTWPASVRPYHSSSGNCANTVRTPSLHFSLRVEKYGSPGSKRRFICTRKLSRW